MAFSVMIRRAESSLRQRSNELGREGQKRMMTTDDVLDEREADALFSLLERRLPTSSPSDDETEDAPQ